MPTKKKEPLPPYDPYSGTVSAPGKNQLQPPFKVTNTTKGPVRSKDLIPNPKLAAGIKQANARHDYLTPELAAAIKRQTEHAPTYKSGGLSPEFIKEQSTASAQRLANKILSAVASTSQGGGGGGSKPKSSGGTKKKNTGTGSKGGPAAPAAPSGPSVTDLINDMYDKLLAEIGTQQTNTLGDYDATKATITNQYKTAQQDLYAKYQATQNPLAAQAANLGVDYGNSSINATQDAAMKRLQETGDLSLTSDLSYLDKMKLMQEQSFGALKTGSLQEKADAQLQYQMYLQQLAAEAAKAKSGGGGGGGSKRKGGGGGSGGSGGVKSSATSTSTSVDTGINSLIADLIAQGDYEGAASVQRGYDIQQGGALGAATKASTYTPGKVTKVKTNTSRNSAITSIKNAGQTARNTKAKAAADRAEKDRQLYRSIAKGYGGVFTTSTVKHTGKP